MLAVVDVISWNLSQILRSGHNNAPLFGLQCEPVLAQVGAKRPHTGLVRRID